MRWGQSFLLDLCVVGLSTGAALLLRDNFDIDPEHFSDLMPYLGFSLASAALVFPIAGLPRSIWRLSSLPDYIAVVVAAVVAVILAVMLTFTLNRLEGVARSLPVLQLILMVVMLVGLRIAMRLRHGTRSKPVQLSALSPSGAKIAVLIVGISRTSEFYIRALTEFAADTIKIVGVLDRSSAKVGRVIHGIPVIGSLARLDDILQDMEIHGVVIDRIYVTAPLQKFSPDEAEVLLRVEKVSEIKVCYLDELMLLGGGRKPSERAPIRSMPDSDAPKVTFAIGDADLSLLAQRPYWRIKRICDATLAFVLLVMMAPAMVLVAILAALDVGAPILFWQQRPGVGGHPFRVYKFRTMRGAHAPDGRRRSDSERLSVIGHFLRRSRLDELPQLYNILVGQMSFVGPRPLLPVDQPEAYAARMLVRPGLTGWAQVNGGRHVTASDKAALDVWYIQNASIGLDVRILISTLTVIIAGEKVDRSVVVRTWQELVANGVCRLVSPDEIVSQVSQGTTAAGRRAA